MHLKLSRLKITNLFMDILQYLMKVNKLLKKILNLINWLILKLLEIIQIKLT